MNKYISKESIECINELFEGFLKEASLKKHDESSRNMLEFSNEIGRGYIQVINLQPGLKLSICDHMPNKNFSISMEIEDSPLAFGFFLSGNIRFTIERSWRQKNNFDLHSGQTGMSFFPMSKTRTEIMKEQHVCGVNITLVPALLNNLLEVESDQIPPDFRGIMEGSNKNHYHSMGTTRASSQMAIHQILNCPYQGSLRSMYLQGKAIELMTLYLAQSISGQNGHSELILLHYDDIERIYKAKDILTRDLENPPSLFELSRSVGLTHTKLNRGFREIYGTTAFGYLRQQRLERSRLLMEEGKMNVAEVAYTTGFSNPSHFAQAFIKYFGIKPSSYLKEILLRKSISHYHRYH